MVDEEMGSILLHCLHLRINEYNDVMMYLLQYNMDIQYLASGEASMATLYYITDYMMKASLKAHAGVTAMLCAIQKNCDKFCEEEGAPCTVQSKSLVVKLVNQIGASQETSHQQLMSFYVGGGDCYRLHDFSLLHWGYISC
ncbi:hypothetical protein DACRYDRAFT_57421 [Dacryopinax primogenitus]|uniref:Uncharacterized protein n=1 Tax=Dacryopinax primogenitus (strain DJM 731) TaxID=1858805 RepID=M5G3V9_DACPD|nr:uncharacterized protein DACRYDRAFT_57421 [Dacryopinax primogenitus]EJT98447.1 hypothetical protein DACRYDRAFT_57421 [Dacryopinax primogenitus]